MERYAALASCAPPSGDQSPRTFDNVSVEAADFAAAPGRLQIAAARSLSFHPTVGADAPELHVPWMDVQASKLAADGASVELELSDGVFVTLRPRGADIEALRAALASSPSPTPATPSSSSSASSSTMAALLSTPSSPYVDGVGHSRAARKLRQLGSKSARRRRRSLDIAPVFPDSPEGLDEAPSTATTPTVPETETETETVTLDEAALQTPRDLVKAYYSLPPASDAAARVQDIAMERFGYPLGTRRDARRLEGKEQHRALLEKLKPMLAAMGEAKKAEEAAVAAATGLRFYKVHLGRNRYERVRTGELVPPEEFEAAYLAFVAERRRATSSVPQDVAAAVEAARRARDEEAAAAEEELHQAWEAALAAHEARLQAAEEAYEAAVGGLAP